MLCFLFVFYCTCFFSLCLCWRINLLSYLTDYLLHIWAIPFAVRQIQDLLRLFSFFHQTILGSSYLKIRFQIYSTYYSFRIRVIGVWNFDTFTAWGASNFFKHYKIMFSAENLIKKTHISMVSMMAIKITWKKILHTQKWNFILKIVPTLRAPHTVILR